MPEFLEKILITTRRDLDQRRQRLPLEELKKQAGHKGRGAFAAALCRPAMSIIAEIKRASPSKGDICPELDVESLAAEYEQAGAAAISVLTEERFFKGSLKDLKKARQSCSLPLLRKDFIVDAYQVWEAAVAGADAILLIVAALTDEQIASLMNEAEHAGLDCLVEVHDREELDRAMAAGARIIGINNRDLHTFEVDLKTAVSLARFVHGDVVTVGESGISGPEDVSLLNQAGINAVLVGETLMRSSSPGNKIKELLSFQ